MYIYKALQITKVKIIQTLELSTIPLTKNTYINSCNQLCRAEIIQYNYLKSFKIRAIASKSALL